MTVTRIEQDLDLSIFEEIEKERACESDAKACDNEPEWMGIIKCCNLSKYMCTPCKNISDTVDSVYSGTDFRCYYCGMIFTMGPEWTQWVKL